MKSFLGRVVFASVLLPFLEVATATPFLFSTGDPNGAMASASRPSSAGRIEVETADDFILSFPTDIFSGTFAGLLTNGATTSDIGNVRVEIYRVFPSDSTNPPSGRVPTRVNSPSDVALAERDVASANLSFTASALGTFTASNSVVNGIHASPNQTTGGEGQVTGNEVRINFTLLSPFSLPADHYFFVPQVEVSGSGEFLWLSGQRPTTPPFTPDLQSWIRNENLAPDWLRIGTDIVGGTPPPTFNGSFSLEGEVVPEPSTFWLLGSATIAIFLARKGRVGRSSVA